MSIFKCKMCGGTLEIQPNATVAECEYCGTTQTLPKLDDGRKANLFDRANHFRRNNEFDKAVGIYEQILNEDGSDAEIYWSLVLCRYGVEYASVVDISIICFVKLAYIVISPFKIIYVSLLFQGCFPVLYVLIITC